VRAVPDERFMTLKEVAEYLHLNERTVYKWAQEGTIPGSKLGSTWRFRRSEVDLWVEQRKNVRPITQGEEQG
jgi:excisionase family DNA binding protein